MVLKKTKRSDKKRNKAKVVKALLKDPTMSEPELKKETGLGSATVHRYKDEVEKNGEDDPRIQGICDLDMKIIQDGLEFVHGKIKGGKASMRDVIAAIDSGTKRNILFRPKKDGDKPGNITIVWGV